MSKSIVLIVGFVVAVLAAALGFLFATRFPEHHEVANIAKWIALVSAPLLLVSLAIDSMKKTK